MPKRHAGSQVHGNAIVFALFSRSLKHFKAPLHRFSTKCGLLLCCKVPIKDGLQESRVPVHHQTTRVFSLSFSLLWTCFLTRIIFLNWHLSENQNMQSVRVQIYVRPLAPSRRAQSEGKGRVRENFEAAWHLNIIQQPKGGGKHHANQTSAP